MRFFDDVAVEQKEINEQSLVDAIEEYYELEGKQQEHAHGVTKDKNEILYILIS